MENQKESCFQNIDQVLSVYCMAELYKLLYKGTRFTHGNAKSHMLTFFFVHKHKITSLNAVASVDII